VEHGLDRPRRGGWEAPQGVPWGDSLGKGNWEGLRDNLTVLFNYGGRRAVYPE